MTLESLEKERCIMFQAIFLVKWILILSNHIYDNYICDNLSSEEQLAKTFHPWWCNGSLQAGLRFPKPAILDLFWKVRGCLPLIQGLRRISEHVSYLSKLVNIDFRVNIDSAFWTLWTLRVFCFGRSKVHANVPQCERQTLWVLIWGH